MGDFFGGNAKTEQKLPQWLEEASREMLGRADDASRIGYVPWTGPDVAAFSPMQNAAFGNTNAMASAFGMGGGGGSYMPEPQQFAGGLQGYSSLPMYEQALGDFKQRAPNQYGAIMQHLVNPRGNRFKPNGMLKNGVQE